MHNLKRYFILFLLIPFVTNGQETNFDIDISEYLDYNGTLKQYEFAYDQLMAMMGGTYPKTEENSQQWAFLAKNKGKAVGEMKISLIAVYKKHFAKGDIKKMSAFYKSESGKLLVSDRSKMTKKHKEELNSFYNSAVGQKIIAKKDVLTEEISKASELWSRDLYETFVSVLSNG